MNYEELYKRYNNVCILLGVAIGMVSKDRAALLCRDYRWLMDSVDNILYKDFDKKEKPE